MPGAAENMSSDAVLYGRLGTTRTAAGDLTRMLASVDTAGLGLKHCFQGLETEQGTFSGTYFWGARMDALPEPWITADASPISMAVDEEGYITPAIEDIRRMLQSSADLDANPLVGLAAVPSSKEPTLEHVFTLPGDQMVGIVETVLRQAVEKMVSATTDEDFSWRFVQVWTEIVSEDSRGRTTRKQRKTEHLVLSDDTGKAFGWIEIQ